MSKRRAEADLATAAKERRADNDRTARLAASLAGLNSQFASWVATHKAASLHKFWIEGVRDYVQYASKLLEEFKDVLSADGVAELQQAAADAEERTTPQHASIASAAPAFGAGSSFGTAPVSTQPAGGFSFGAAAAPADGAGSGGAEAAAAKASAPATGFFAPPASGAAAASSSAPAFGSFGAPAFGATAAAAAPASTSGGFTFGAAPPPPASAAPAAAAAAAAEKRKADGDRTKDAAAEGASGKGDAGEGAKSSSAPAAAAAPALSFGVPTTSAAGAPGAAPAAAAPKPLFAFGAPDTTGAAAASAASTAAASTAALAGSIFGAAAAGTAPAFPFGAAASGSAPAGGDVGKQKDAGAAATALAPAAPTGGFFFGAAAAPGAGSAPAFSFGAPAGAAAAFSFGAAAGAGAAAAGGDGGGDGDDDGDADGEQDECAKEPSLKVDDSAVEFLFKEKARLQVPVKDADGKIGKWESKGIGSLSVRKPKAEGAKPYIALFTDSGRCLYQAYFNKQMKLVVSEKQKSVAFTAAWSPDGVSPPALNPALFQLAAGKNRAFEEVVTKLQAEMPE